MAKTKAELLNEYRDLKKENLKLTNTIRQLSNDEDNRRAIITKLRHEVDEWKRIARKENDRVADLASELDGKREELTKWVKASREYEEMIAKLCTDMDECEKEKTLIKSQRDVLLKEKEEHLYQINDLQESFDILQAEVRKIQIDEEVIHDQAYEEGFNAARNNYQDALTSSNEQLKHFAKKCRRLEWVIDQIYENQTK